MGKVSKPVVINGAVFFNGANTAEVLAFTHYSGQLGNGKLIVQFVNEKCAIVPAGSWVVEYAMNDVGILSDGAYRRFFDADADDADAGESTGATGKQATASA